MSDEATFLAAIQTTPSDVALRLIYADWLEEHGQQGSSELIRVSETMRDLPVFSDEYWQLKARRNELRMACPPDWLAVTGYDGSRYDPLFRDAIPPDLKGRWRLIREFTERWHGIPMCDVGGRLAEVDATERRLGRQLPASLREYVAYAHEVASSCKVGVSHRDDITMELRNGLSSLTVMFWERMQRWAIPYRHLSEEDPPVSSYCAAYIDDDEEELPIEGTDPTAESLSDFVLAVVDDYKPKGGRFTIWLREDTEVRRQMSASFPIHVAHHRTSYVAGTTIVHKVFREHGTIYEGAGILAWVYDWHVHGGIAQRDTHATGIFRTNAETAPET